MPFPFGKSQKNPAEIVKSLKENVAVLEKLEPTETKKCEKVIFFFYYLGGIPCAVVIKLGMGILEHRCVASF
ncbi:UNVERIFIED_CONTAM: hypothetical protein FKN15_007224 [Acipenser sinensis]